MIKTLLLFISGCLLLPFCGKAQIYNPTIGNIDSTIFTFKNTDSLYHHIMPEGWGSESGVIIDTSGTSLWQIGDTHKPVFSTGTGASHGIMTDTLNPYPHNVNSFFVLKVDSMVTNLLIEVWHEYQTDSAHAGGAIEFSTDSGLTWVNTAHCYLPSENMPTSFDTLFTGDPAFTGNSSGQVLSQFQFMNCFGVKTTSTGCSFGMGGFRSMYIRFRFISDSFTSTKSGWKIDSIRVVNPGCTPGYVAKLKAGGNLTSYPNPAFNGVFNLPELNNAETYMLEVYNNLGQMIISQPYKTSLDLSKYPKGLYLIKATNGVASYKGTVVSE